MCRQDSSHWRNVAEEVASLLPTEFCTPVRIRVAKTKKAVAQAEEVVLLLNEVVA